MTNMFSGNIEKKVPNSFNECYISDNITINLWTWCEVLENIGKILAILVSLVGIIASFVLIEETDGVSLFLLLGAPIASLITYLFFHIDALLIGSLASIVQHTKISANTALYNCKKANENEHNNQITNTKKSQYDKVSKVVICPSCDHVQLSNSSHCDNCGKELKNPNTKTNNPTHSWRCEKCKKLISSYPCVHCGHKEQTKDNKPSIDDYAITCPKCGKTQPNNREYCYHCNHKFN